MKLYVVQFSPLNRATGEGATNAREERWCATMSDAEVIYAAQNQPGANAVIRIYEFPPSRGGMAEWLNRRNVPLDAP